jgi:hypothetical protein
MALTPEQLATPLMKRPYDYRHAGITWRLNSGVPAADVAKWAGHGVEVLSRIYAGCMAGMDEVWISRMSAGLHFEAGAGERDVKSQPAAGETGRDRTDAV